jgi:DNA polymerase I-like protein with 3'-5' exonuclease and polymerase domains
MKPVFLDFETEGIEARPKYPPQPVGLAIYDPEGEYPNGYHSFGHASGNNTTKGAVKSILEMIYDSGREICFHNAMFDLDVAEIHLDCPMPDMALVHDTLILAFLHNPHVQSLSLKDLVVTYGLAEPTERDELKEWIVTYVDEARRKKSTWGAYICRGPADLVGRYAEADVKLTSLLFEHLSCQVLPAQAVPYLREMQLIPMLLENSRLGVRVDREGLEKAKQQAIVDIEKCNVWVRALLGSPDLNVDSDSQLVESIYQTEYWDKQKRWPTTDKGQLQATKETFEEMLTNEYLRDVLRYRANLSTCLSTFIEPWLDASASTGRIYTNWNSVRGERGGTRTGRLSSTPNFQNAPVRYPKVKLPADLEVADLPLIRSFILPDEGHKLVACDFNAQELRIFAHFESGNLMQQYQQDARADLHTYAAKMMTEASGREVSRTYSKGVSFAILYGAGPKKISEMLEVDYGLAKTLMDAYTSAVAPGLKTMQDVMRTRYKLNHPLKTLGGRLVKMEPPKIIQGRLREFDYKGVNLLIQGSAADQAKAAMLLYQQKRNGSRLLLSVHDELVISAPIEHIEREAETLTWSMCNALDMDVPMVSDYKVGDTYQETK